MLTTVSQMTPRARALQARQTAVRILGASGTALIRHRQQARGFRFGMWSSYLDPEFQREIRRRQRMMKHKYAESLNRRLSWEKHPFADDTRAALKRMARNYWPPHGRFAHTEHEGFRARTPENKTGMRPGQNIEDVERGAMEHLFHHSDKSKAGRYEYDFWMSPFQNIRNYFAEQEEQLWKTSPSAAAAKETPKEAFQGAVRESDFPAVKPEEAYVIDPITNRRVPKHPAPTPKDSVAIPEAKTFKAYRSQFSKSGAAAVASETQTPVFYDGPPPPEELRKYKQVNIDENPEDFDASRIVPQELSQSASSTTQQDKPPVLESEEYIRDITEEPAEAAREVPQRNFYSRRYRGVFWHRSNGVVPESSEQPLQSDKDIPDNFQFVDTQSVVPPKYDDLAKYKPIEVDEVNTEENTAPEYEDLHKYKPVMVNESEAVEESQPEYEDLDKYKPVMVNEADITEDTGANPQYEDLDKYKPVMVNENQVVEEPVPPQEELEKYTPVMVNETEADAVEESTPQYEDLGKYNPVRYNEPDGKLVADQAAAYDPAELAQYQAFRYLEPDGKPVGVEESAYDPAELAKYQPFMYLEPDGKPESAAELAPDAAELSKYSEPVMWNEPDGQPPAINTQAYDPAEVGQYQAVRWNEPNGKPTASAVRATEAEELQQYTAVRYQEPDGKPSPSVDAVQSGLEEFDVQKDYSEAARMADANLDSADLSGNDILRKLGLLSIDPAESEKAEDLELLCASDIRAAYQPEPTLTGNYARDFPEEFQKSWSATGSEPQSVSSQGHRVQPALDRQGKFPNRRERRAVRYDPYSTEPQGLQTSYAEEIGGQPTWPTFVKTYGDLSASSTAAAEPAAETQGSSSVEPTVYKILAYDPTMQKINAAETSSVVPDTASALTPAEVLLRLSNPTKFFPHFAPLQAQGYEIVSGSGDVLVFRKVRSAQPDEPAVSSASAKVDPAAATGAVAPAVNPIDMTGGDSVPSPASANFASPTGYLTYAPASDAAADLPPPPPRFKSNIDVRREEPVFSGPKADAPKKKKKSMGKRLVVGAAWVAGVSYALGVVGEYFVTGGVDGMGPRGL